uniref:Uncharacterized protein n=1 Tax=Pseudo-nitzschia australis TaxID=44445 RepID=A0A7S4AFN9_9STRA|mmetsp:Transcript_1427/g.3135  ORF Transcript_1427/g.3135 Transcript_1427/m.3135 type:complete len:345 (+) Transcript_1427:95-1129(+)
MVFLRYPSGTVTITSVYKKGNRYAQLLRGYHHSSITSTINSNATIEGITKDKSSSIAGIRSAPQPRRAFCGVNEPKQKNAHDWSHLRLIFAKSSFGCHVGYGDDSFSCRSLAAQQRRSLLDQRTQRWFSSSKILNEEQKDNNAEISLGNVDYTSPLGALISRLKMVSVTGCFLSVCVLPALVFLKNGDLPSARQLTLGTFATIGATGSTVALHFVFGAYVLEMKSIDSNDDNNDNDQNRHLLEATTRSIFGFWKDTHVFDPRTDVAPYSGMRPFANFCANNVPLYVHPERLNATTRQLLLHSNSNNSDNSDTTSTDDIGRDAEGHQVINEGTIKKKKNDDDELF